MLDVSGYVVVGAVFFLLILVMLKKGYFALLKLKQRSTKIGFSKELEAEHRPAFVWMMIETAILLLVITVLLCSLVFYAGTRGIGVI